MAGSNANNANMAPAVPPSASGPQKPRADEGEAIMKGDIKIKAKIATPQQKDFCATPSTSSAAPAAPDAPSNVVQEVKKPLVASPEQPGASTWYCCASTILVQEVFR